LSEYSYSFFNALTFTTVFYPACEIHTRQGIVSLILANGCICCCSLPLCFMWVWLIIWVFYISVQMEWS